MFLLYCKDQKINNSKQRKPAKLHYKGFESYN